MKSCICKKCGLKVALQEEGYYPYCFSCACKVMAQEGKCSKYMLKYAIKMQTKPAYAGKWTTWTNPWGYKTKWNFFEGWSARQQYYFVMLFAAILKGNLNKTPKITEEGWEIAGFPEYWHNKFKI